LLNQFEGKNSIPILRGILSLLIRYPLSEPWLLYSIQNQLFLSFNLAEEDYQASNPDAKYHIYVNTPIRAEPTS
jgi:hypothetical protein